MGWLAGFLQWVLEFVVYAWPISIGSYDHYIVRCKFGGEPRVLPPGTHWYFSWPAINRTWLLSSLPFQIDIPQQFTIRGEEAFQFESVVDLEIEDPFLLETSVDDWKDIFIGITMKESARAAEEEDWPDVERVTLRRIKRYGASIGLRVTDYAMTSFAMGKIYTVNGEGTKLVITDDE